MAENGYGRMSVDGKLQLTHRYSYALAKGAIPAGMLIDHVCLTPRCVNPAHLRLATQKQNAENRAGAQSNNKSSGIRGVTWNRQTGKWHTHLRHNGRNYSAGEFHSLDEAEAAVIAKRNTFFTHNELDRAD